MLQQRSYHTLKAVSVLWIDQRLFLRKSLYWMGSHTSVARRIAVSTCRLFVITTVDLHLYHAASPKSAGDTMRGNTNVHSPDNYFHLPGDFLIGDKGYVLSRRIL